MIRSLGVTTLVAGVAAALATVAGFWIWWHFDDDIQRARVRSAQGNAVIDTRFGPIEVRQAGAGVPLMVVHGSGGGQDQDGVLRAVGAPVSLQAAGLRCGTAVGRRLVPAALEMLETLQVPTLIVSARGDRYGTSASAAHTARGVSGAKVIGFEQGGHTRGGHDDEVMAAIVRLLVPEVGGAAEIAGRLARP